jgi:hypothetical protein
MARAKQSCFLTAVAGADCVSLCFGCGTCHRQVASVVAAADETTDWVRPIAAFYVDTVIDKLAHNLAAGSADSGFVLRVPSCFQASSVDGSYAGNEVPPACLPAGRLPPARCTRRACLPAACACLRGLVHSSASALRPAHVGTHRPTA